MSTTHRKYDVFLSFRGLDTRRNFISFFYRELVRSNIQTFKDDMELESGRRISPELKRAIEESKFAVVVVSKNYTASPWCLEELVEIMDLEENGLIEVIPIFYGVDPSHVRRQIKEVAQHFEKHKGREDHEKVLSWRQALTKLADLSGYCACESCKWADEWEMVNEITDKISKRLMTAKPRRSGRKLEGIDRHMEDLYQLLDMNSNNETVRVIGIWARGGNGRTAFAKFVYESISQHFQSHCFLESVKRISQDRHMSHLHQEFLEKIQGEYSNKSMLKKQKVLLVADDANKLEQLDALADDFNCFGPGSIVIITTQDKQLLNSYGITLVYEVDLKFQNDLLRQPAFKRIGVLCRQLSFKKRDEMVRLSTW